MTGGKSSWFAALASVALVGLGCLSLGLVESSKAQEKPAV